MSTGINVILAVTPAWQNHGVEAEAAAWATELANPTSVTPPGEPAP